MRIAYVWRLGVAVLTVAAGGLLAPTASAAVPLGGGAGIMVDGTLCTLTTIGHDKAGDLVGFTAASCGGPGSPVAALGGGPIGSVVAVEPSLKYGVIKFDPAELAPTANFAGFAINGVGPDPGFRQPACTDGAATGIQCVGGITTLPSDGPGRNMSRAVFQPGDEGRPVTTDDLLFGMAYRVWFTNPGMWGEGSAIPETTVVLFSRILDDVNAKGGPGAGFTPVPA